jgi:hypothetical protein
MPDFYDSDGRWVEIPGAVPEQFDDLTRAQYVMGAMAEDAVGAASEVFGKTLDYTPPSIIALEAVLAKLHADRPRGMLAKLMRSAPSKQEVYEMAVLWGGYLGEVLRLNHGGVWEVEHPAAPGEQGYFMHVCGENVAPVIQVQLRLADPPGASVVTFYEMLTGQKIT